jgi:hypothetical protein
VATLAERYENEAMVAPVVVSGGVYVWRESRVRRSFLGCCVWRESDFSRREDVFRLNSAHKEILKLRILSVTVKDRPNATINCFTVKHKLPPTSTGHTLLI